MRTIEIGGLPVRLVGGTDREGGGTGPLVVLLHGFGAPGDDLVPLHRVLDVPRAARFAFPHAPLSLAATFGGGARAWWQIDVALLEETLASGRFRDLTGAEPVGLTEARAHVVEVLDALRRDLAPSHIVLGGFSQGAMLATDVALRTDQKIDALALLSGTLLAEDVWIPKMALRRGLPALVAHGTHDPIVPFALSERLAQELTKAGLDVDFVKFRGQHEIPPVVLERLGALVTRVCGTSA